MKVKKTSSLIRCILRRPNEIQSGRGNSQEIEKAAQSFASDSIIVIESLKTGKVLFSANK